MGKHDRRIPVLRNLCHRRLDLLDERFDILIADKRRKVPAEIPVRLKGVLLLY